MATYNYIKAVWRSGPNVVSDAPEWVVESIERAVPLWMCSHERSFAGGHFDLESGLTLGFFVSPGAFGSETLLEDAGEGSFIHVFASDDPDSLGLSPDRAQQCFEAVYGAPLSDAAVRQQRKFALLDFPYHRELATDLFVPKDLLEGREPRATNPQAGARAEEHRPDAPRRDGEREASALPEAQAAAPSLSDLLQHRRPQDERSSTEGPPFDEGLSYEQVLARLSGSSVSQAPRDVRAVAREPHPTPTPQRDTTPGNRRDAASSLLRDPSSGPRSGESLLDQGLSYPELLERLSRTTPRDSEIGTSNPLLERTAPAPTPEPETPPVARHDAAASLLRGPRERPEDAGPRESLLDQGLSYSQVLERLSGSPVRETHSEDAAREDAASAAPPALQPATEALQPATEEVLSLPDIDAAPQHAPSPASATQERTRRGLGRPFWIGLTVAASFIAGVLIANELFAPRLAEESVASIAGEQPQAFPEPASESAERSAALSSDRAAAEVAKRASEPEVAGVAREPAIAEGATELVGAKGAVEPVGAKGAVEPVGAEGATELVGAEGATEQALLEEPPATPRRGDEAGARARLASAPTPPARVLVDAPPRAPEPQAIASDVAVREPMAQPSPAARTEPDVLPEVTELPAMSAPARPAVTASLPAAQSANPGTERMAPVDEAQPQFAASDPNAAAAPASAAHGLSSRSLLPWSDPTTAALPSAAVLPEAASLPDAASAFGEGATSPDATTGLPDVAAAPEGDVEAEPADAEKAEERADEASDERKRKRRKLIGQMQSYR